MNSRNRSFSRLFVPLALAISVTVSSLPLPAFAGPGDVNSVNNGQVVQGGTYYNTPGNKTTFTNSGGGGLWVQSGTTVRGLESDLLGTPTGNGGWLHFYAPGSVVRIDGTVNVNGLLGSGGGYLGNGGRVTIDSAFLYQNGNIFANGLNGGLVQFNVGGAMFGPNARVEAMTKAWGNGGQILLNSPGIVDIQKGAVLDSSGMVIGTYDTNIINIEGGLINMEGVLRADGVDGSQGGIVRLIATGMSETECVNCAISQATGSIFTAVEATAILDRQTQLVNTIDGDIIIGETEVVPATGFPVSDPSFGLVSANGADAVAGMGANDGGNGGDIVMTAQNNIVNGGVVRANGGNGLDVTGNVPAGDGGNGGTISLLAGNDIINNCLILADGGNGGSNTSLFNFNHTTTSIVSSWLKDYSDGDGGDGGDGGLIAFSYGNTMQNSAIISANGGNGGNGASAAMAITGGPATTEINVDVFAGDGGHGGKGGLIVFSGDDNPTGGGIVTADGGNGGRGGDATAKAFITTAGDPLLTADAVAGNGGNRGDFGLIVAPDPAGLPAVQNISMNTGQYGNSGTAYAEASGTAGALLITIANATTGALGEAIAISNSDVDGSGNATALAGAHSGNYGKSTATANASADTDNALSSAVATAGDFGIASADATADGAVDASATADAITLENGFSIATTNAVTTGTTAISDVFTVANATSGNNGISVADADGTAVDDAEVTATATAGDDGYASADAKANSTAAVGGIGGDHIADANASATTGVNGKTRAIANGSSQDKVDASAESTVGAGGASLAQAGANTASERTLSAVNNGTPHGANGTYGPGGGIVSISIVNGVVGAPPSVAPTTTGTPSINSNTADQLEANELLINNGTAVLVSTDSGTGGSDNLTAKLDDATVRTVAVNDGSLPGFFSGAYDASDYGNLVIGDIDAGTTLTLDQPLGNVFDQLRFMTVLKDGSLVNPAEGGNWSAGGGAGGGHISWLANWGNILNAKFVGTGGTFSGGSVNMMAGQSILNVDQINTSFGEEHGGSIMLKAGKQVLNAGQIKADANHAGGKIVIQAKDDVINLGHISANALGVDTTPAVIATAAGPFGETVTPYSGVTNDPQSQGGIVKVLSGDIAHNLGVIEVDGAVLAPIDDVGTGGYVRFHGNALAINDTKATIQANGNANGGGGQIVFTAGDNDHSNDTDPTFGVPGPVMYNGVDINIRETAANFGELNATGGTGGGQVAMGGNNQLVVGTVNTDNLITFVGQNIGGFTAVNLAAACNRIPPETPGGDPDVNLLGLFQQDRPEPPPVPFKLLLSLENAGNSGLFSANGNTDGGVTDAFMALAFEEYHNQQLLGVSQDEIKAQVMLALENAGASAEVAQEIAKRLEAELGVLSANNDALTTGQIALALEQYYKQLAAGKPAQDARTIAARQLSAVGVTQEIASAVVDQMEGSNTANIFMASTYLPVTQRIVKWAMDDYHRQLSIGNTIEEARRHMVMYLTEVGVDADVAVSIQEAIQEGKIEAPTPFTAALDTISVGTSCGNLQDYTADVAPPDTSSPCGGGEEQPDDKDQLVQ